MEVEGLPVGGAESAPASVAAGATTPVDGGKVDEKSGVVEVTYVQPSGAATEEQALATVTSVLGGTVEPTPDEEPPTEPVEEPSQPETLAVVPPAASAPMCGAPGKTAKGDLNTDPISGCGKDLAEENRDVVNIGFIRTTREGRPTYLCAACIAAHKASKAS
jgi:hypothetical protein